MGIRQEPMAERTAAHRPRTPKKPGGDEYEGGDAVRGHRPCPPPGGNGDFLWY